MIRKLIVAVLATLALGAAPACAHASPPTGAASIVTEPVSTVWTHCTVSGLTFRCPLRPRPASFWGIFQCATSVAGFIVGNLWLIAKAKKAGGVWKTARRIWKAKGFERKMAAAVGVFGYVTGVEGVVEGCT